MCRFLLVRSKKRLYPGTLLQAFAGMCQKSHAPDGDWQGDGWGVAWKEGDHWQLMKSLAPIWEEEDRFSSIGQSHIFVAHARSAGFPQHKGVLAYNQPYIHNELAYVFNGMMRGVALSINVPGNIGAQKIFSLIVNAASRNRPDESLSYVRDLLRRHTKKTEGMNIGLVLGDTLYALCDYENNPDYFSLRYYADEKFTLICSEPIGAYEWRIMGKGEILTF